MNKQELNSILNTFINKREELLAEIYFILKDNQETKLRMVDIDGEHKRILQNSLLKR